MNSKYDAIIVGAGHNGLVTAAYLARGGRKVLVLERRKLVGGCAVTEEVWPGYRVSTAAYLSSLLQDRIVQDLDLEHWGYRIDAKDPSFFSPFPDGRYLIFWGDEKRTLQEIAKFSKRDAETFPELTHAEWAFHPQRFQGGGLRDRHPATEDVGPLGDREAANERAHVLQETPRVYRRLIHG